ncbi:MAG TPA: hypothetical protein VF073_03560 [Gaiella sp.]
MTNDVARELLGLSARPTTYFAGHGARRVAAVEAVGLPTAGLG